MRAFKKIAIYVLFSLGSIILYAQQVTIENPLRFLALGDSYTIGQSVPEADRWPVQLTEQLKNEGVKIEELKIIAQTGWRTDDLLDAITREKPDSSYNLVSLLIGVNNQYQGMDINKYPGEFKLLLQTAIALCGGNSNSVFVLSIPDYGFTPFGAGMSDIITAEINEYNRINREISQEMSVAYFDITPISREVLSKPEYLAPDNLHPSGEMYAAWVKLMFASGGIKIVTTNVSDINKNIGFYIFPNPASEKIHFLVPEPAIELCFYNIMGTKIYHESIEKRNTFKTAVSNWETGIYFYRIKTLYNKIYSGSLVLK